MSTTIPRFAATIAFAVLATGATAADRSVSVPVSALKFADAGVGRLQVAAGFGDAAIGAHGTFVKLPAGYSTPLHIHGDDYYGVVISGVVVNERSATDKEHPMPSGSYWFQQGKANHVTKCVSKVDCVAFISQPGRFDFVEAK